MKILGIRTAPQQVRYALVDIDGDTYSLLNSNSENSLKLPVTITSEEAKLRWVKEELSRVIRQNPDLTKIALKLPEFSGPKTKTSRLGDYFDAMVLLAASESGVSIVTKLYSQMATKRAEVKRHAEDRIGKTSAGWNDQMADAIAVAWIASK